MKVILDNVYPNPFRDFGINPLEASRTAALIAAVESDEFWSNLQIRKHPSERSRYELVFGHHRLDALRKLGHKTWDIEVVEIDDDRMFNRMIDENLHQGGNSPLAMEEAVIGAKSILDWHLSNCETVEEWNEYSMGLRADPHEIGEPQFSNLKKTGVGKETVGLYLEGKVSRNNVKRILSMYEPEPAAEPKAKPSKPKPKKDPRSVAERSASRIFSNARNAQTFLTAARNHNVPTKNLEKLATRLELDKTGYRDIEEKLVSLISGEKEWEKIQKKKDKDRAKEKANWRDKWKAKEAQDLLTYARDHLYVTAQLKEQATKMIPYLENLALEDEDAFFALMREWAAIVKLLSPVTAGLDADVFKKIN